MAKSSIVDSEMGDITLKLIEILSKENVLTMKSKAPYHDSISILSYRSVPVTN